MHSFEKSELLSDRIDGIKYWSNRFPIGFRFN